MEDAPVVVLDERERKRALSTKLRLYTFEWEGECNAVALGFGGLYNHSKEPNLRQGPVLNQQVIRFTALRDIAPGEELTHDYKYDPVKAEEWYRRRFYGPKKEPAPKPKRNGAAQQQATAARQEPTVDIRGRPRRGRRRSDEPPLLDELLPPAEGKRQR